MTSEARRVERRKQYLATNDIGLRETVAEAAAWSQLGYSASGIAKKMDVTEATAKKYKKQASASYNGILLADIDDHVEDFPDPPSRECPVCLHDKLCTPEEAEKVFLTSSWGATNMLDEADRVCSWCHCVRVDGEWKRMEALGHRAREIADAGNKSMSEAKDSLRGGITPGRGGGNDSGSGTKEAENGFDLGLDGDDKP